MYSNSQELASSYSALTDHSSFHQMFFSFSLFTTSSKYSLPDNKTLYLLRSTFPSLSFITLTCWTSSPSSFLCLSSKFPLILFNWLNVWLWSFITGVAIAVIPDALPDPNPQGIWRLKDIDPTTFCTTDRVVKPHITKAQGCFQIFHSQGEWGRCRVFPLWFQIYSNPITT